MSVTGSSLPTEYRCERSSTAYNMPGADKAWARTDWRDDHDFSEPMSEDAVSAVLSRHRESITGGTSLMVVDDMRAHYSVEPDTGAGSSGFPDTGDSKSQCCVQAVCKQKLSTSTLAFWAALGGRFLALVGLAFALATAGTTAWLIVGVVGLLLGGLHWVGGGRGGGGCAFLRVERAHPLGIVLLLACCLGLGAQGQEPLTPLLPRLGCGNGSMVSGGHIAGAHYAMQVPLDLQAGPRVRHQDIVIPGDVELGTMHVGRVVVATPAAAFFPTLAATGFAFLRRWGSRTAWWQLLSVAMLILIWSNIGTIMQKEMGEGTRALESMA
jgi:hypothetical protein